MPKNNKKEYEGFSNKEKEIFKKLLIDVVNAKKWKPSELAFNIFDADINKKKFYEKRREKKDPILGKKLTGFIFGKKWMNDDGETSNIRDRETLWAIHDYLVFEEELLPKNFHEETFLKFKTAYFLSKFFFEKNEEVSFESSVDLAGAYEGKTDLTITNEIHILDFSKFEGGQFYEIEQEFAQKTSDGLDNNSGFGWAVVTSYKGIFVYLENIEKEKFVTQIFMIEKLNCDEDLVTELEMRPYRENIFQDLEKTRNKPKNITTKNLMYINVLSEFLDKGGKKAKESKSKVVDISKAQADRFKKRRAARTNLAYKVDDFKETSSKGTNSMSKQELETEFLYAVFDRNLEGAKQLIDKGVDVNCRALGSGNTALHLAASRGDKEMIRLLYKTDGIEFLVQNNEGHFPSMLAMVSEHSPVLANFLSKKQIQEAKEKEIDYLGLIRNKVSEINNGPIPT